MRAGIECKISLAKKLPITLGGLPTLTLSFNLGTFANASDRNFFAKDPATGLYSMTGPFAANVLATRTIDGHLYGLFEEACNNKYKYSLDHTKVYPTDEWIHRSGGYERVTVNPNKEDPNGGSTAFELVPETGGASSDRCWMFLSTSGTVNVLHWAFVKYNGYHAGLQNEWTGGIHRVWFDLINGTVQSVSSPAPTYYGILSVTNGWYFIYIISPVDNGTTGQHLKMLDASFNLSFTGNGTSSIYLWQSGSAYSFSHLFMPIITNGSAVTKAKDVFYWPNAVLPDWLKGSQNSAFSFNFIPNYSSVQHVAKAQDTFLFSVDGTENVECYIAGADQKLYIDVDSVNRFTSASAFTWSAFQNCKVTLIPNNGANCRVITSGFTSGNADETGTIISMQDDGDLYWAMRHTTNDLQLNGIQSVPRYGRV